MLCCRERFNFQNIVIFSVAGYLIVFILKHIFPVEKIFNPFSLKKRVYGVSFKTYFITTCIGF